jgi:hypothetical protein
MRLIINYGKSSNCKNGLFELSVISENVTALNHLFINSTFLRLPEIYRLSTLLFMYKFKNGFLPSIFNDFFHKNQEFHNYPTRRAHHLRTPKTRLKLASSFIKHNGVILFHEIPPQITNLTKIGLFKKEIKNILLTTYI